MALAGALRRNVSVTSLNLESNSISSDGIDAIATMITVNSTLKELRLANQHLSFSQVAEGRLAAAVQGNRTLTRLSVDMRAIQACRPFPAEMFFRHWPFS